MCGLMQSLSEISSLVDPTAIMASISICLSVSMSLLFFGDGSRVSAFKNTFGHNLPGKPQLTVDDRLNPFQKVIKGITFVKKTVDSL